MINLSTKTNIVIWLLVVWLATSVIIVWRINTLGAYSSVCATKSLDFVKTTGHADPASIRLNQSYTQWALALNMIDPSNYIKVGLSMVDGKGLSLKNISPEDPANKTYLAYYFQPPGTPIVIGTMIKLFGQECVMPYFILVLSVHFVIALLACILASCFMKENVYIFGAGLLSLLCLPALDFNFGAGLFSSEPFAALFVGLALIVLSKFYKGIQEQKYSYKDICKSALAFGLSLGCASYFRDVYTIFAYFVFAFLFISCITKPVKLKKIGLFVLIGVVVISALEYPWEKRNQRYFNEFTMAGSTYCGYSLWYQVWSSNKELAKWSWDAGTGLGNYLAPEKSAEVLRLLAKDKQAGNKYAWKCFIEAICRKPWQALSYKLKVYDTLWFGQRCHWSIYVWCLVSTLSFISFIWLTRFKFYPALYLFPLFMLCISCVAHYEHRYVQPFFLFITPITLMYVIRYCPKKSHLVV